MRRLIVKATQTLLLALCCLPLALAQLSGTLNVDNEFEAYISTNDAVEGTLIASGTDWRVTNSLSSSLTAGQDYYLHIKATDVGGVAGFLGEFELSGNEHTFANGLRTLNTNTSHWYVSTSGWSNYQLASAYGVNGVSPWGTQSSVDSRAEWIWSSDNDADDSSYFSTKISATRTAVPIVEYRFDACSFSGASGDVVDSQGNLNASSNNTPSTSDQAVINKSLDLTANNTNDWLDVPSGVVDGLDDFSVAVWFKTEVTKSQQEIFQALGSDESDDELEIHLTDNNNVTVKVRDNAEQLTSSIVLTNGNWHHLVVTRENSNVCLFIDGAEQDCTSNSTAGILSVMNANAIVIGQEQDQFGGGFTAAQSFEGELDEFKIFDIKLTNNEIQAIYANELAGDNYDGTTRNTLQCEAVCEVSIGVLNAVGIKINNAGSNNQINTTTEAQTIYSAWLAAGSPFTGLIDGGTYNVSASGESFVDRIDFGGSNHEFAGTLPYPGASDGVGGENFLVHTSGTVSLPAGDYTIYVESDDGFSFIMNTLSGDTVSFNNFGSSSTGASNELRFENPTANSNMGGSFTLSQDSIFEVQAIFYERGGGDFLEISIANDIRTNAAPSGYEILRNGALDGKVKFGQCASPVALAEYRFEESVWNGTLGEVLDNTGNGYHGQVITNSSPEVGSPALLNSALTNNLGTCGYASQNRGAIQVTGLPLDTTTVGVKTTVTFWMNWDDTDSVMPIGWNIHDIWMVDNNIGFNSGGGDLYGTSSSGLANVWNHIAVEFTNGSITGNRMHINGVEQTLTQIQGTPNNSRAFVDSEMRIGGWSINGGYNFKGLLDEVRIYEGSLSTAEVQNIMTETHECAIPLIHHYEISHDGQGLTCDTESVTIKACADASCSSLSSEPVSLDFVVDGAVISSPTFIGSTSLSFNNTEVETVTLSIANASITADNPLICDDSVGNSCDMAFVNAGFRFLSGSSNSTIIPNQISGSIFADTLKVQAVEDINGVCTGLFSGNKVLELSQENIDPGGISGLLFNVQGNNIAKHPSSTSTTLNFGADSIATIPTAIYHDAGQIRLHANYNVGGIELSGNSNAFWVSPAQLLVSAASGSTVLNGANATATPVHKAGENFDLMVTAVNSLGVTTPNYSPGQIQFQLARSGPLLSGSVDGSLTYAAASNLSSSASPTFQDVTLSSFSSGVSTFNAAHYSEVGVLTLDVQDSNYGNANIVIPTTAINIGRFIPHHFVQTIAENGVLATRYGSNVAFAAYSGQKDEASNSVGAISYLSNPVLEITAYNKQGNITQNYYQDSEGSANDFMKLSVADISITVPTADGTAVGVDATALPLTANMSAGTLSQNDLTVLSGVVALPRGVLHYQLSDADHFFYNRSANALVGPFTSDIDFTITAITDADNVAATSTVAASPTGVEVRFGRLLLENSFGPETSDFPQAMQIQYFDGTQFIASADENNVSYNPSQISLTNMSLDPDLSAILGNIGQFTSGKTQALSLQAPGAGNQGQIGVSYDTFDWFEYDWDGDGVYDESPTAIATFGIYRGNDRIIHWREVFN